MKSVKRGHHPDTTPPEYTVAIHFTTTAATVIAIAATHTHLDCSRTRPRTDTATPHPEPHHLWVLHRVS